MYSVAYIFIHRTYYHLRVNLSGIQFLIHELTNLRKGRKKNGKKRFVIRLQYELIFYSSGKLCVVSAENKFCVLIQAH